EPPLLVAELVSTEDASCFGAEDGEAVISVTGGTPPYTFDMDGVFADGFFTISGLAADTYTVNISDAKNCGPAQVTFEIEEPAELVIDNVDVIVPDCAPDNFPGCETPWAVSVVEDMTIEGYSTYGDGTVSANRRVIENVLGEPDFTNSPPITYVSLGFGGQLVMEAGCEIVNGEGDDFEVVETSYGQNNCANYPEKADVWVAQTIDGPWSYLGETCLSGAFDLSNGVDDSGAPFVLDWARYVKVVDATNPDDFSNGDGFDLNGIHIFNTPEAPITAELEITITPEVEGAIYTILNAAGEVVDINNISENGTYTIFFEYDGCFSNEYEFEVVFPEPIMADATVSDVSCFGGTDGSAQINITGGTAPYTIIFDGEEIEGNIIAGLAAGSYEAVIVDANGCVEMVQFDVDEPTQLVVEQDNGEILCFEGTTFVSLDITGGTAPYVLTDDNSDFELAIDEAGLLELDAIFAYGQYNWTVTDANGCFVGVEFFLEQPELLVAEESYAPITCFGGTTDVTVTATGGTGSYILYNGETLVAEFDDFTVVNDLGMGSYNWTVVDANECETEVSFDLEEPTEFTADYVLDPEQILCHNGLTDVIVTGTGGTEPYFLTLGNGNVIEFNGQYTVSDIAPGMLYSWTVTDANECVVIPIEFEIENPDPIVVVSVDTEDILCHEGDNGFINIVANGGTGALTYALDGGVAQDNGYFENLTAGDYEITITDANGCYYVEYVTLTEPEELVVDLELTDWTEEEGGTITGMISGGVGPYNVCLFTNCEVNDDEANEDYDKSQGFMHFGLEPGSYQVVVTDQNGCQWIECVEIGIEEKDDNPLSDGNYMATEAQVSVYPNPFTTQATIEFSLTENSDVTLEIYNLVGERVAVIYNGQVNAFESHKHTFNAESLPNGIYIYRLTAGEKVFHDRIVLTR
ncbi:MAG: T9SS type A sorting domain-containing protein, partial [Actinobacteria bacterium]|nr:T9SS type A sorting domain-containing protein [Actinomycetota bacterium]